MDKNINDGADYILSKIDREIESGATGSNVCATIFNSFFDLMKNSVHDKNVIDSILEKIDVNKYKDTILFGFLSASNFRRKELNNYDSFLNKMKEKIRTRKNSTDEELKDIFYGLE